MRQSRWVWWQYRDAAAYAVTLLKDLAVLVLVYVVVLLTWRAAEFVSHADARADSPATAVAQPSEADVERLERRMARLERERR